jgi:hypothetical protein
VLEVADGGVVLFTLSGLSNLTTSEGVHVMTFLTEHERSLWLNDVIALGEGSIDLEAQALSMRYYACEVEDRSTPS